MADNRDPQLNHQLVSPASEQPAPQVDQDEKLGLSMLAKVALAVVVLVSLIISISCLMQFNRLEEQRKELEAELSEYNEAIRELQEIGKPFVVLVNSAEPSGEMRIFSVEIKIW